MHVHHFQKNKITKTTKENKQMEFHSRLDTARLLSWDPQGCGAEPGSGRIWASWEGDWGRRARRGASGGGRTVSRWALSSLPVRYPHWVLGRNSGVDPSELRPQGRCLRCSWRGGPLLCTGQRGPGSSLEAAGDAHGLGQGLRDRPVLVIPESRIDGLGD